MIGLLFLSLAAEAPPAEQSAIFTAARFAQVGGAWKSGNCEGAESDSYAPGTLDRYEDLNGDGRPDAVVSESGAICYGMAGTRFWLLSKQVDGSWKLLASEIGMPEFLQTKGADGWPDLSIGGPGFCFPVQRWSGKAYAFNRFEYDGKRCEGVAP